MSFRVEVEVRDDERAMVRIRDWSPKALDNVLKALQESAVRLRNKTILQMQRTPRKTGTEYARQFRKNKRTGKRKAFKWHMPSQDGAYPAIDRGGLVRSLIFDTRKEKLEVEFGSSIAKVRGVLSRIGKKKGDPQYPKFLETGTRKMRERPWLEPTLTRESGWIKRRVEQAIQEARP